jgi:hypothetical protein
MAKGARTIEGRFIEVTWGFHSVIVGSKVSLPLRWMMLEKIPRDIASWCWPCVVTKLSHMGVDVDGLACPLHRTMACNRQMRC